jgi:hypothetical protein
VNSINRIITFAVLFLVAFFKPLLCQQTIDARGTAMAFSNAADTRGLEQVGLNPATLALPHPYRFEFNIISLTASARNNSFSKSQYDKYFTTGRFLDEDDKNDILSSIPDDGLRGDFSVRANTLAFYMPYFSLSLAGLGNGFAKLPSDLPELAFGGNTEEGRTYQIGDMDGDGWGGLEVLLSGAYPVYPGDEDWWNNIAIGATMKFIAGLAAFEITESDGKLINYDRSQNRYYATIDQKFEARTSEGGRGIGLDFGAVAKFQKRWTFGLTFLNVFGSINWTGTTEKHLISLIADSLAISETFTETPDSVVMDTDTTFAIGEFSTGLPKVLDLGAAYQALPYLLVTAEYEQGLTKSMAGTTTPRFAIGAEYIPPQFPYTPIRTGFSIGGRFGSSFAFGFGVNFRNWILDLAYIGYGGIFPGSAKGLSLAATTRLRF